MMKKTLLSLSVGLGLLLSALSSAPAQLRVVATTPELASIAREVGGNLATVTSLVRSEQDYHRVEARPPDVVRIASADLFVRVGMDMDMWADALLQAARNPRVAAGGPGYVDASARVRKLGVPTGRITAAQGDVHPHGNPHYWLDPANAKVIAYQVLLGLRAVDPKNASTYDANYRRFAARIDQKLAEWQQALAPFRGRPVVAYHEEWLYFYSRFGLTAFGYIEPKPGIPPSGAHINQLIQRMRQANVRAVIVPTIYPMRYPNLVAQQTGARVARVPYSVPQGGAGSYIDYMDTIVRTIRTALQS